MKDAHSAFVEKIRARDCMLLYNASTPGIVTTSRGPLLPVALVSVKMLQETGSTRPVKVFLANKKEFDWIKCGQILPVLNAKCLMLQDIFDYDKTTRQAGLDRYQYKRMSVIFSSLKEALFLDIDCFPIHKPN